MAKACQDHRRVHIAEVIAAKNASLRGVNLFKASGSYSGKTCGHDHTGPKAHTTRLKISLRCPDGVDERASQRNGSHYDGGNDDERNRKEEGADPTQYIQKSLGCHVKYGLSSYRLGGGEPLRRPNALDVPHQIERAGHENSILRRGHCQGGLKRSLRLRFAEEIAI